MHQERFRERIRERILFRCNASGLTLIELLLTLGIASIVTTLALPSMINLVRDNRSTAAINSMIGQVQYLRSTAITARRTVTLCPGRPPHCGKRDSWHTGSFVFIDYNKNGQRDSADQILRAFGPAARLGEFTWRSFRNRKSLSINGTGLTNWQNGSFRYCPSNGDERFAHQAILNAQARVRYARDRDGDGIREDAQGRPISCR